MKYALALSLALLLNATANLLMKFGVRRFAASGVSLEQGWGSIVSALASNWVLAAGLTCFAMNVSFYTYALSGIKISTAYPIMVSGGFGIIAVVAWKYLDETLTWSQWAGIAMILVGVFLVARQMQSATAA